MINFNCTSFFAVVCLFFRLPALDESGWLSLLGDILEMQSLLFHCISNEDCYEVLY